MKRFKYDVYENDGTYITTWNDVVSEPSFSASVNSGLGEIKIVLPRLADDFGESDDVAFRNQVIIRAFDDDDHDGVIVFNGWISGYTPVLEEGKEYIEVNVLSYVQELSRVELLDNGSGINDSPSAGNTKITYTSQEPSDIIKDIIDKYNDLTGIFGKVNYAVDSLDDTGITIDSYTFDTCSILDAINKIVSMSPANWYWYLDENNIVQFHEFSETSDHILFVKKDVNNIKPYKRVENVKNICYVIGKETAGVNLLKKYERAASITNYGRSVEFITDGRITDANTAQRFADAILDTNDEPEVRTQIKIVDNNNDNELGYDIESIHPGDVITVLNFLSKKTYSLWGQALWGVDKWGYDIANVTATKANVVKVDYTPNSIYLEVSSILPQVSRTVNELRRRLDAEASASNPSAPV